MEYFGTAVILCGGKSSRMGFDKCKIKVKNKFLIEIIAEQLEQIFQNIIFVSDDIEKFGNTKYGVVKDIVTSSGPIGAIYTGLKQATSRYVFVTACDMPIINLEYIKYMMQLIKNEKIEGVVTYNCKYIEPLYAFYSIDMISTFEDEIQKHKFKILDVIKNSKMYYVEEKKARQYSSNMDIFTNLNYTSDLSILKNIFGEDSEI